MSFKENQIILPYDPRHEERVGREDSPAAFPLVLCAFEDVIRSRGGMALLVQSAPERLPVGGELLVQPELPSLRRGVWNEWDTVHSTSEAVRISLS